jgi:hypothetical protein
MRMGIGLKCQPRASSRWRIKAFVGSAIRGVADGEARRMNVPALVREGRSAARLLSEAEGSFGQPTLAGAIVARMAPFSVSKARSPAPHPRRLWSRRAIFTNRRKAPSSSPPRTSCRPTR